MAESSSPVRGRIFINYRRQETAYPAGWLFDRLAARFGADQIFKDVDSIDPGEDFVKVIRDAVGSSDVLLALIGHEWLTLPDDDGRPRIEDPEDFVRLEIEAALAHDVLVIPVLVGGATMPDEDQLPPSLVPLAHRQALELSPARFDFDTTRLLRVLDKTLAVELPAEGATPGRSSSSTELASGPPAAARKWPRRLSRRAFAIATVAAAVLVLVPVLVLVFAMGSGDHPEATGAGLGKVVFQDDFSGKSSGWDDADGQQNGGHYTNGSYRLVGEWTRDVWSQSSFPRNAAAVFPAAPAEVRVSVVARRLRGKRDVAYGIVCRADPGLQSYYQFAIWPGSVVIEKFVPVGQTYFQFASGDLSALRVGGENRLTAMCATDQAGYVRLEFQLNGRTVASAIDTGAQLAPPLLTGTVGLVVAKGSEQSSSIEAEFDDFVVTSS
jgi:TIR domain